MMRALAGSSVLTLCLATVLSAAESHEGHDHADHSGHDHGHDHDWFRLRPHLNAAIALGGSTSEKNLGLVRGSHAPIDDGFNLQGIELGAVAEFGENLSLHANHNFFWDNFDAWDSEWEEAYAAVKLPAGFGIRGGQFFAPFGYENTLHLHDRRFVEPPISMIRLLGEEGLIVQGAELVWAVPAAKDRWVIRLGYGQGREHSHGARRELRREAYLEGLEHAAEHHEEGEEEEEEEEHREHHSHGVAGNGGVYDPEEAYLDDGFFFGRIETKIDRGPVERAGISFAAGQNGFKRTTWTAGADIGGDHELGGFPLWWQGEAFYRAVEARDEAGIKGDYDEMGIYMACGCEFAKDWTTGSRVEWASGNRMAGNERRWRAAANVGRRFQLARSAEMQTRLQYTYDRLGGYADEHSIWLQFVLNLGAADHGHQH
jgi:hypothetical protein